MKIAIVIPIYNEERNIQTVVTDWLTVLTQLEDGNVICINDGSTDRSLEMLQILKEQWPELIILDQKNGGHGKAILSGYQYAVEHEYDYIFQVDGDDQIRATEFLKLWRKKMPGKSVLGFREYRQDPWIRRFVSRVLTILVRLLFNSKIVDLNVPYRLIPLTVMQGFLQCLGKWQPFAPNVFLSIYLQQFPFEVVTIEHRERQGGENSLSLFKLARAIIRSFLELLRWKVVMTKDPQNRA